MGLSADHYARQLKALLPQGSAWDLDTVSDIHKTLLALADELARVDARGDDLLKEWNPATAVETLADWERILALTPAAGATTSARQAAASAAYTQQGGSTPAFFIALALQLGFTATIDEFLPTYAGSAYAGMPLYGSDWAYAWRINLTGGPTGDTWLRSGTGHSGDRIRNVTAIETMVQKFAPAHTIIIFNYL